MSLKEYIRNILYSIARHNVTDKEIDEVVNRVIKAVKKDMK